MSFLRVGLQALKTLGGAAKSGAITGARGRAGTFIGGLKGTKGALRTAWAGKGRYAIDAAQKSALYKTAGVGAAGYLGLNYLTNAHTQASGPGYSGPGYYPGGG